MDEQHKVEVFSAGCSCCDDAVRLVRSIVDTAGEVEVLDMHIPEIAARAKEFGVTRAPAVVVDGRLAGCCAVASVDESTLRAAGLGAPR